MEETKITWHVDEDRITEEEQQALVDELVEEYDNLSESRYTPIQKSEGVVVGTSILLANNPEILVATYEALKQKEGIVEVILRSENPNQHIISIDVDVDFTLFEKYENCEFYEAETGDIIIKGEVDEVRHLRDEVERDEQEEDG
jgi:hypothetical protein